MCMQTTSSSAWRGPFSGESGHLAGAHVEAARCKKNRPVKLRKSCDFCWRRKLRCEGGTPCQNCAARSIVCTHSPRKQRGKPDDGGEEGSSEHDYEVASVGPATAIGKHELLPVDDVVAHVQVSQDAALVIPNDGGDNLITMEGEDAAVPSRRHTRPRRQQQAIENPQKRARLTPSSATGFLGLAEHSYLTAVLDDFLYVFPFVDQGIMREALVHLLDGTTLSPPAARLQGLAFDLTGSSNGELEGERELRLCADGRNEMALYQASCAKQAILWGGVAIGALLMGSPVDAVTKYAALAEAQLKECFDANDEYTADAYMMLAFMHLLLQDHTKYFRYLSFSNNLWTQLPAARRPNLRFVYMVCGLLSHVYGVSDTRARLILASLENVHDGPDDVEVAPSDRLLDDIERIPTKPETAEEGTAFAFATLGAGVAAAAANGLTGSGAALLMGPERPPPGGAVARPDLIVPRPMKDVAKAIIGTFHTSYGSALYDPRQGNVLLNRANMAELHALFSGVHARACTAPAASATFRIIVSAWLMVTKLALGRYHELLEQAESVLAAVEEMPGLARMANNPLPL
eukprot:TRINITY_DN11870_c0_g1_i1.p1 TRINITY_DN11870_c0_g1~~TRINITY_DN11870_c0_g1_i1.p1  ORF type:complete len:575 (-),score=190.94 TRINITY_DN11870_c0_g1_i1:175-1899(-)